MSYPIDVIPFYCFMFHVNDLMTKLVHFCQLFTKVKTLFVALSPTIKANEGIKQQAGIL